MIQINEKDKSLKLILDYLKSDDITNDTYKSNTAYGVLTQGFGICSGYSDAMKLFLDKLNIINYNNYTIFR